MAKVQAFLAGVMDAYVFVGSQLVLTAKALSDSSISIGLSNEEIRGGKGAKLLGRYYHTSSFTVELQDSLFQLDYIAMNVGTKVTPDGTTLEEEEFTVVAANTITVAGTPADFMGYGKIGWYAIPGSDDWTMFTFTDGGTATGVSGVTTGTTYCVKYINDVDCKQVIINADFVPDEVTLILKGDLFKASKGDDISSSSKIGYAELEVPRFQLNGTMDMSLNMTGAAQTPLSGTALATTDGTAGCENGGYYAKFKRIDLNSDWTDDLAGLAVVPASTINMSTNTTTGLVVYGVFKGNMASKRIDPAKLTYTTSGAGKATVDGTTGIISAGSDTGTTVIAITVKNATGEAAKISESVSVVVS